MNHKNNVVEETLNERTISHRVKHIETRVKREVIIENGLVISDSGPQVTTKISEDDLQKFSNVEHKTKNSEFSSDEPRTTIGKQCPDCSMKNERKNLKTYFFGSENEISTKNKQVENRFNQQNSNNNKKMYKQYYFGQQKAQNKSEMNKGLDLNNASSINQTVDHNNNVTNQQPNNNSSGSMNDEIERDRQIAYEYDYNAKFKSDLL